jgi:hypothetical protein
MRYLIAMLVAALFAITATLFFAGPFASFVVRQYSFDSPDTVADLHAATFMLANLAALLLGYAVGWAIGKPFAAKRAG